MKSGEGRVIAAVPGVERVLHVEGPFDVVAEVDSHDASTREALPLISEVEGVLRAIPLHVVDENPETAAAAIGVRSFDELQAEPCNA